MTYKLFLAFFGLALFSFSCSNIDSTKKHLSKSWFDTDAYPKKQFLSVVLFTLDSSQKTTITADSGTFVDTNVLEYVGKSGYSFVAKTGIPKAKKFHAYQLDSLQITRLGKLLVQQPCLDGLHLDKACAPTFKNVFVFYNENKIPIAALHVCFLCELTAFTPDVDYMCDFDNKIDYKAFKNFTDSIKYKK